MLASVWTDISVRSNVLLQHAWLLTANATFSTYVLAPPATSHVHILFIGLVPAKEREREREKQTENKLQRATIYSPNALNSLLLLLPPSHLIKISSPCGVVEVNMLASCFIFLIWRKAFGLRQD